MHSLRVSPVGYPAAAMRALMNLAPLVLAAAVLLLMSSCSKSGGHTGMGGISFTLRMPSQGAAMPKYKVSDISCEEYGVVEVNAQVHNSLEELVATDSWPCEAKEGTIRNIEEGSGYIVAITLEDSSGNAILRGSTGPIQVVAGQITDAGIVELVNTNNPPVFDSIAAQQVNELQPLSFTVNATDPDGDNLTYSAANLPSGATFEASSRLFYWIPGPDQSGNYTVTFQATDDGTPTRSATLEVAITVGNVNRQPVLSTIGTRHFTPGTSNSFTVSATDPDGDALTYYAADMPQDWWGAYISGPAFDPLKQTFVWNNPTSRDEYRVLFIVTDNGTPMMSDYEWVTIQVYDTNPDTELNHSRYPVLDPIGRKQVSAGTQISFRVSGTDPDTTNLTYNVAAIGGKTAPPNYSTLFNTDTNYFTWTPSTEGNYWLRFIVTDSADHTGYGLSDSEDIVITVGDINRPPVLNPIGRRTVRNSQLIEFTVSATDPDNNSITYSTSARLDYPYPTGAGFDPVLQKFSWTPNETVTPPRDYWVRFVATDNGSPQESVYEDVMITVLP